MHLEYGFIQSFDMFGSVPVAVISEHDLAVHCIT